MEPVTLVVTALTAGAAAGITNVATGAIAEAYEALRSLVVGCFRRGGVLDVTVRPLIDAVGDGAAAREALTHELSKVDVDEPTVQAAQQLLDLLELRQSKFQVDARESKGIIVGDHAVQHNTFNG